MNTLRLIAIALLIVPVGIIMLTASAVACALTLAMRPFCYLRNTGNLVLEDLLRDLWGPRR